MPRYVIDVAYKGSNFSGWQKQANAVTVQEKIDKALTTLLRQDIEIYGAGRTDAGVHGVQMPAHFSYDGPLHPSFMIAINAILPHSIAVTDLYRARREDFHARFDATYRRYKYQMIFQKAPLLHNLVHFQRSPVDEAAMREAAEILMEYDSFESFCKSGGSNKTFFCKITESRFEWEDDKLTYWVKADRFLRGMVRAIVGTLLMVGEGKLSLEGLREVIEAKDRRRAGSSVPAWGLYLMEVGYPEGELIPYDPAITSAESQTFPVDSRSNTESGEEASEPS